MTTPGGQLTPGDDSTPPVYGVPDGAYVGDAGSPNAISQLSYMTEASAKQAMQAPIGPSFTAQRDGLWGVVDRLLGLVQGGIDLVVGVVDAVVGGIQAIINSIGSLFGAARHDVEVVDAARVAGENAIVANMSSSLEYLDEIQRVGGAYGDWPEWLLSAGHETPHPLPLGGGVPPYYGAFPLSQGVVWHPPVTPLTHTTGHQYGDSYARLGDLAMGGGTLELAEPGLWMIYFQAALLQGPINKDVPSDVWCYVTADEENVPIGAPTTPMVAYNRTTGARTEAPENFSAIHTFGRAGQYLGTRDSTQGGGNTVSGYMMCYLDSPGWFVHLACSGFQHFGGAASTFVFAQKVNSSTLRGDINQAKADLAAALPGVPTPKDLDEASIAAMVAQAQELEATPVEVPPFEEAPGD